MLQQDPNRLWYLHRNGQQHGPMSDSEFQRLVSGNLLQATDFIWFEGLANWTLVSDFPWASLGTSLVSPPPPRQEGVRQGLQAAVAAIAPSGKSEFAWPQASTGPASDGQASTAASAGEGGEAQRPKGAIFISYRRSTDAWTARAMFEHLVHVVGEPRIVIDIEGIDPGESFRDALRERLRGCSAFVPLIGPSWIEAKAKNGHHIAIRRPNDVVRLEIELALEINRGRQGFVVPLLIDDAQMPDTDDLPASIAALANCQAMRLTHTSFRDVMADLRNLADQRARESQLDQSRMPRVGAARPQQSAGVLGGPLEFPKIISR